MELRKPAPAAPGPHRFGVSRTTPGSAGVFRVVGSSSSSPLIPPARARVPPDGVCYTPSSPSTAPLSLCCAPCPSATLPFLVQ